MNYQLLKKDSSPWSQSVSQSVNQLDLNQDVLTFTSQHLATSVTDIHFFQINHLTSAIKFLYTVQVLMFTQQCNQGFWFSVM